MYESVCVYVYGLFMWMYGMRSIALGNLTVRASVSTAGSEKSDLCVCVKVCVYVCMVCLCVCTA